MFLKETQVVMIVMSIWSVDVLILLLPDAYFYLVVVVLDCQCIKF